MGEAFHVVHADRALVSQGLRRAGEGGLLWASVTPRHVGYAVLCDGMGTVSPCPSSPGRCAGDPEGGADRCEVPLAVDAAVGVELGQTSDRPGNRGWGSYGCRACRPCREQADDFLHYGGRCERAGWLGCRGLEGDVGLVTVIV